MIFTNVNKNVETKDGPTIFVYENGNILSKGVMINGKQEGLWENLL